MYTNKPDFLKSGERARLFPVLADTSKEGRATSIFLACLSNVDEYANGLLSSVGRPIGPNSRVEAFTEVVFNKGADEMTGRPDGLITVRTGSSTWSALIEAKIGNSCLHSDQINSYLRIAKSNDVDAVITISNEYAATPSHHPVQLTRRGVPQVALYHWSWMRLLTEADLLITNNDVQDTDQRFILNELRRFLAHESTGVRGFHRMPPEWPDLVRDISAGRQPGATSTDVRAVVSAWHQETHDLCLSLSRQTGATVRARLTRAQASDHQRRLKEDTERFASDQHLHSSLIVPGAAADIDICIDVRARSMTASMTLDTPTDRQSTAARINWQLRQLKDVDANDIYVRVHWPRRGFSQHTLKELREDVNIAVSRHPDLVPKTLEICMVRMPQGRFIQVRNFVDDLEQLIPDFYIAIGQSLRAWQPPAPKARADRRAPEDVTPAAIEEDAEQETNRPERRFPWRRGTD
ncbi:MAG: hypothetical protein AAFW65_08580 [Pseudomonadota bacterium]